MFQSQFTKMLFDYLISFYKVQKTVKKKKQK